MESVDRVVCRGKRVPGATNENREMACRPSYRLRCMVGIGSTPTGLIGRVPGSRCISLPRGGCYYKSTKVCGLLRPGLTGRVLSGGVSEIGRARSTILVATGPNYFLRVGLKIRHRKVRSRVRAGRITSCLVRSVRETRSTKGRWGFRVRARR